MIAWGVVRMCRLLQEAIWWVGASGGKMTAYGLEKSDACLCLC